MSTKHTAVLLLLLAFLAGGCQSAPPRKLLPAPAGTGAAAAQHNEEGIAAYGQGQWAQAGEHFQAAVAAAPSLAEAHYNLGMALYKLGRSKEADGHFMEAANLAPGNKVIWDSPPFRKVHVPSKDPFMEGSGSGHQH